MKNHFSATKAPNTTDLIRTAAKILPDISDKHFGSTFNELLTPDTKIVLLGESSHGTSEFYRARAALSQHLIQNHGFTMVAVEADWPDAAVLDRHLRGRPPMKTEGPAFNRFPTWMWRNTDAKDFFLWLKTHNLKLPKEKKAAFYGLDLYNLGASMRAVIDYLDHVDPPAAETARERYGCLDPWSSDPQRYGRMALGKGYGPCEKGVVAMLQDLLENELRYVGQEEDYDEFLDAEHNARLVKNAEKYYRAMYYGEEESWNLRDTHMFETLDTLLKSRKDAKIIVWAHNSHIGDARYSGMGMHRKELNLGQLTREKYGESACLIGFGTHTGTVAAASDWDSPMKIKSVNPSRADSYEKLCHDTGIPAFALDLREGCCPDNLRNELMKERLERFIGVIYRPDAERWSHYSEAILPKQFDCYVWFDETKAVTPLAVKEEHTAMALEETYPFGL